MSNKIRYKRTDRSWGMKRVDHMISFTPGEWEAIQNHAKRTSQMAGIDISPSNAIVTTMKQVHDDIREEAELIDKEWKKNGRKYSKKTKLGSTAQG